MKQRTKQYATERKLILPYALIMLLIVGVIGSSIFFYYRFLTKKQQESISNSFSQLSDTVYSRIGSYVKLCDVLAMDSEVQRYARKLPEEIQEASVAGLQHSITNLEAVSNAPISEMITYFPKSKSIVTGTKVLIGAEAVESYMAERGNDTLNLKNTDLVMEYNSWSVFYGDDQGWIVRKLYNYDEVTALIIVGFRCADLMPTSEKEAVILIGDGQGLTYSNLDDLSEDDYQEIRNDIMQDRAFQYKGTQYAATLCISSLVQKEIAVALPIGLRRAEITQLAQVASALIVLCVAILAVVSLQLYRRILEPLRYFEKQNAAHGQDGGFRGMLNETGKSLQSLRAQNKAAEKEREFLVPLGVGEIFSRLGNASEEEVMLRLSSRAMNLAGILPDQKYFVCGIFHLEDEGETFSQMQQKAYGITPYWVLSNVMRDLFFCDRAGVLATVGKYYMVFAACKEDENEERLGKMLQTCVEFYIKHYQVKLAITEVAVGFGVENLKNAVQTVYKRLRYMDFWHCQSTSVEVEDAGKNFELYMKSLRNLINRLDSKDYEGACECYQTILEHCLPNDTRGLQITKYRLYGMLEMLVASVAELDDSETTLPEKLDFEKRLARAENFEGFRKEADAIFKELMELSQSLERSDIGGRRMAEIRQYIDAHFADNDLSAATLSKKFQISGPYLSREFKRFTGSNLLDYIQRLRLQRAKELLPEVSVKDAAVLSGFYDTQALTRAFKKYEGITPGEYKRFLERQED